MNRSIALVAALLGILAAHPADAATRCVAPGGAGGCFSSIQDAIDAATSGDVVQIAPGTYQEDVVVTKPLTLAGAGEDEVVIHPATSNANPCAGSSLCGGAATNIILVEASQVTIRNLTLDGDNPSHVSAIVRDDADIDARNGIITNHLAGVFQGLTVHHVTVINVYLRGIYASTGGTFNFHHNTVTNVQGDELSIGLFNFGGAGVMADNHVSKANDAISANHSSGVRFLRNHVTKSASGVHTDNAGDGGGVPDLIEGNQVSDGTPGSYGIWSYVPYLPVVIRDNEISGVDVGLAAFGQGAAVTTTFADNRVTGGAHEGSAGAFVTTDQLGFGANNVSVTFDHNAITGFADGLLFSSDPGATLSVAASCGTIRKTSGSGVKATGSGTSVVILRANDLAVHGVGVDNEAGALVDAVGNWWGCPGGPGAHGCATIAGPVSITPWLTKPSRCAAGDEPGDHKGKSDDGDDDRWVVGSRGSQEWSG